jgi:SsrA-binding protein
MSDEVKVLAANRKARFDYHILETVEAGLVLTGGEIKSMRQGEATINEAYVRPQGGELFLLNAYIKPYSHSRDVEYDPRRPRKLLLHRKEIDRLVRQLATEGMTLVPLQLHLKGGRAKLEVALGRGKSAPDKRESIKRKESDREMARAMSKR